MSYQAEKISGNQARIDFIVTPEAFEGAMQQAYLKNRGRINVPGFRKGKAPRKLIETMYGESVFYDDAFDQLFPDLYDEAVEKEDLFPVDQPDVKVEQIGSGKELKFSATVYVKPEVALGKYMGLKGTRHLHPVPEEEIDHRISHDVEKVTVSEEVKDRALEEGDTVDIDFEGSVDGVPFEGGKGQGHKLKLGSGSFIPGFEEQVAGMKVGETKTITVTFPAEYHEESLAGKEAQFEVKVNAATHEVKPALDDDFAQDVSEHKTFANYRAAVVRELEEHRDRQAENHLEDSLVQQAVDAADCDIPEAMVRRQTDRLMQNMEMQMLYQGIRLEDYLKYTNSTQEDLRDRFRQDALTGVKTELVLDAIAKAENVEPTQEEVDAEIARRAREMGRDEGKYREGLSEQQLENYRELARTRKTIDLIKGHAEISVHEGEHEEGIDAQEVLEKALDAVEESEAPKAKKPAKKAVKKDADKSEPAKKPAAKKKEIKPKEG